MRKLEPKDVAKKAVEPVSFFGRYADDLIISNENKEKILSTACTAISVQDQWQFYPLIEELFSYLGFKCRATRAGDTNNRSDAYIIDTANSIPIEIKSPTEIPYINNKSIRQAIENKTILLSRKFYPTTYDTTSLAVGFNYPAERSGVYDLVEDAFNVYGYNIGFVNLTDLLSAVWEVEVNSVKFDKKRLVFLKGQFK